MRRSEGRSSLFRIRNTRRISLSVLLNSGIILSRLVVGFDSQELRVRTCESTLRHARMPHSATHACPTPLRTHAPLRHARMPHSATHACPMSIFSRHQETPSACCTCPGTTLQQQHFNNAHTRPPQHITPPRKKKIGRTWRPWTRRELEGEKKASACFVLCFVVLAARLQKLLARLAGVK
jgi:hypothetical protein